MDYNCVNYKSKDVKSLAEELGIHPLVAATKIAVWQDKNGIDKWPTAADLNASTNPDPKIAAIENEIKKLPIQIFNSIHIVNSVPKEILNRSNMYFAIKDLLGSVGITDPLLINWAGINKDKIGSLKDIKSTEQLENMVGVSYAKKALKSNYPEFKENKEASKSFDEWKSALEKYPDVFKDIILGHATKYITKADRESKYMLSLSKVALSNTYGDLVNKPYEANRLGKLYDENALKSTSDAVGHEPSESGKGYWVHIPREDSSKILQYGSYIGFKEAKQHSLDELNKELIKLNDNNYIKNRKKELNDQISEALEREKTFSKQEPGLDREDADKYGFQDYKFVRVESSYSRGHNPHPDFLNVEPNKSPYEGYYIHGYNTDDGKPRTKIVPISKEQAEEIWKKDIKRYPMATTGDNSNKINNARNDLNRLSDSYVKNEISATENSILVINNELSSTNESDFNNKDKHDENVVLLRRLSPSTWCTASSMTDHYVNNYDNYLLIVDGVTVNGIEATDRLSSNGKIIVNEVTSRNNNGIASIDHLDDTLAFFKKHNLEEDNHTIQAAKNSRGKGRTDKDVSRYFDPDWREEDYEGYDPEQQMYDQAKESLDKFIADNHITNTQDFLDSINSVEPYVARNALEAYMYSGDDVIVGNPTIGDYVQIAVDQHYIANVDTTIPYYNELVKFALGLSPKMYEYLPTAVKENVEYRQMYDNYLEKEARDIETERLRLANMTPEAREIERMSNADLPFSKTSNRSIQGYYDPNNDKVVVVANNTPTDESGKVAVHEIAHRGMIRMAKELGGLEELTDILKNAETELMKKLPELLQRTGHKDLNALITDYGFNPNSSEGKSKLLMELAARWAESFTDMPHKSWWKKLIESISNWIKKFANKTLSYKEVNDLVGGFVKYGSRPKEDLTSEADNSTDKVESISLNKRVPNKDVDDIYNRNLDVMKKTASNLTDEHGNKWISATEYTKLQKKYNDITKDKKVYLNPSMVEVYKVYGGDAPGKGSDSDTMVRFKVKDRALQLAYDSAEKEYKRLADEPITMQERQDMISGVNDTDRGHLEARGDTQLSFLDQLFDSQKGRVNGASKASLRVIDGIAKKLKARVNIDYKVVSDTEATSRYNEFEDGEKSLSLAGDGTTAFYDRFNGTAYLIDSKLSASTTIHEIFGHPFLDILKKNPELHHIYNDLALEAVKNSKNVDIINENYDKEKDNQKLDELILASLSDSTDKENFTPTFWDKIQKYWKQFTKFISDMFGKRPDIEQLRPDTTIEQIKDWLLFGKDKINLLDGSQRKMTADEVDNVLSALDSKRLGEFNEGLISFKEALSFNDRLTQSLVSDWVAEHGAYDINYIKSGIRSDLAAISQSGKAVRNANGDVVANFNIKETKYGLILSDIVANEKLGFNNGLVAKTSMQLLKHGDAKEILIRDENGILSNLLKYVQEDSIMSREINGENYLVLSDEQSDFANKVSLSRRSLIRKAAEIEIPEPKEKESSLPTELTKVNNAAKNLLADINTGLKSNLLILKRNPNHDVNTVEEMKMLLKNISANDTTIAAINFIDFAYRDTTKNARNILDDESLKEIGIVPIARTVLSMTDRMFNGEDIPYDEINFLQRDFIPMYNSLSNSIQDILTSKDSGIFNSLDSSKLKDLKFQTKKVAETLAAIERHVNLISNYEYEKLMARRGDEVYSPTMKELLEHSSVAYRDLSTLGVYFGSPKYKRAEQLRTLYRALDDIHAEIDRTVANDGVLIGLAKSWEKVHGHNPFVTFRDFMEFKDGKATGYMTSDLLRGQHSKDIETFTKKLVKKYGLKNRYDIPTDPKDAKAFNEELDDYKSERSERMFVPEYYAAKKKLSVEAGEALTAAKENLTSFSLQFRNKDWGGVPDTRLMTPGELNQYYALKREKTNISSLVNLDGSPKDSVGKKIAEEVSDFYKEINRGMQFYPKWELFDKAYDEVLKNSTQEVADKWRNDNTRIVNAQEWYDKLDALEKMPQIPAYDELNKRRKAILNLYRNPDTTEVPAYVLESIPVPDGGTLADTVKKIDIAMAHARNKSDKRSGEKFTDIARIEPSDEYQKELRAAVEEEMHHPGAMEEFDKRTSFIGNGGYRQLFSYWTKIVPKDEKYISDEPNSFWSELDSQSEFVNRKFDINKSEGGLIPKKSLYDNSAAYNKIQNDPNKKEFHDLFLQAYRTANACYPYRKRPSEYRLGQYPGHTLQRITKGDTFLSGFKEVMKDKIRYAKYDDEIGDWDTRGQKRIDGSKTRFVSTRGVNMLNDRDSISRDMIGTFEHFYHDAVSFRELSSRADEIEMLLQGIKNTRIHDSDDNDIKSAGQSNMYKLATYMVSSQLYGDQMASRYNIRIKTGKKDTNSGDNNSADSGYQLSFAKPFRDLTSWIKKVDLTGNIKAILANAFGSQINLKVEATCGIWMNNAGYRKGMAEVAASLPSAVTTNLTGVSYNKLISMMRTFGVSHSMGNDMKNLHGFTLGRNVLAGFTYGAYTAGDYAAKGAMLVSVLNNFKPFRGKFYSKEEFLREIFPGNRVDGETVFDAIEDNLYDAFECKDGILIPNPKFDGIITMDVLNYATAVIKNISKKLDGTLTQADKGRIHADAFGNSAFAYRGFLQSAWEDRFHSRMWDHELRTWSSGDYRLSSLGTSGKIMLRYLNEKLHEISQFKLPTYKMGYMKNDYEAYELYNFRKLLGDWKWILMACVVGVFASTLVGETDDDKRRSWQEFVYIVILRTILQLGSVRSPADSLEFLQSPTQQEPFYNQLASTFGGIADGTLFDPVEDNGRYQYMWKISRDLIRMTPGVKQGFETFVKPDFSASENFMNKNMISIYNVTKKVLTPTILSDKRKEILDLKNQEFLYKKKLDNDQNKFKTFGYEETAADKRQTKINKRKETAHSKIINRRIKNIRKSM